LFDATGPEKVVRAMINPLSYSSVSHSLYNVRRVGLYE
jgi:hypothetical protein